MFIGDPHLKINRFELAKQFLTWLNELVKKHKPDRIVNLGDTFDTHAVLRSEIMTEFLNHVDFCLANTDADYDYVLGNHDMYKPNDARYHALKHLKNRIERFNIIDEITEKDEITFVPYLHNPADFPKHTKSICIAHQEFKGADYGDITTKNGVDASSIKGASIIISGHIHKRQQLNAGSAEVLYVGSPFSQSAGDINQIKGITIFDTETFNQEFIPCPLPSWRGIKFTIDEQYSATDMLSDLEANFADENKDHWVVEITGPKAEIMGTLSSKKCKDLLAGRDIKIKTIFTDKEKRKLRIEAVSLDKIISEYVDKVYNGSIDKSKLKSLAADIIQQTRVK